MKLKTALPLSFVAFATFFGGCATESTSVPSTTQTSTPASTVSVQKSGSATLRGTLSYPGSASLPSDASANVALVRSTYIEEAVDVVNSVIISPVGSSPVRFSIPYDPAQIKPGERYSVAARVFSGGKLLMRSNAYLVFNFGGPSNDLAIDLTPAN